MKLVVSVGSIEYESSGMNECSVDSCKHWVHPGGVKKGSDQDFYAAHFTGGAPNTFQYAIT